MLNDDKTTFQFVQSCLVKHFSKTWGEASYISVLVHTEGSAVVGAFTLEVAEHKSFECQSEAAEKKFPFACEPVKL